MTLELWRGSCKVSLLSVFALCNTLVSTLNDSAFAQVVPDSTLANESSLVTPNGNVRGLPATLIEGGATRGVNLLQSFSQFNVGDAQRVYFANPTGIENILTRVTGNNVSNILGTLGVDGNANLFFLNPNGIVFGQNASLDVAGSFLATTADSIVLENGLQFSANPQVSPLLSVSVTPGLQFGANPGNISSSANLTVGKDLTLAGQNLYLQGELRASEGLILQAQDTAKVAILTPGNPLSIEAGNKIEATGQINTSINGGKGGDIKLTSGAGGIDTSGVTVTASSDNGQGGNISLTASGDIFTADVTSFIGDGGVGKAGDITIESSNGEINTTAGGAVGVNSAGLGDESTPGQGGNIKLTARGDITAAYVGSYIGAGGIGNGGNITITSQNGDITTADVSSFIGENGIGNGGDISITSDNGNIDTTAGKIKSSGFGRELNSRTGGNINLTAKGNITTATVISSIGDPGINENGNEPDSSDGAIGNGGDINITSLNGKIDTTAGGALGINSVGFGTLTTPGKGGDIKLKASGDITTAYVGSFMKNRINDGVSEGGGVGNGGNITIESTSGKFSPEGEGKSTRRNSILSFTTAGKGGAINITANSVSLDGARLSSEVSELDESGQGGAGSVSVNANSIDLRGATNVSTNTIGPADAGNVNINAQNLTITDGSQIQSQTFGEGKAGIVSVKANSIDLSGTSNIKTNTNGSGDANNVNIKTQNLTITGGSQVQSSTFGTGKAGDVFVNKDLNDNDKASSSVTISGFAPFTGFNKDDYGNPIPNGGFSSGLLASTENNPYDRNAPPATGDGGNITVNTGDLKIENGGAISARSRSNGNAGNIEINVDTLDITGGGQVVTSTFGSGEGGNINVTATGDINISGNDTGYRNRFQEIQNAFESEGLTENAFDLTRFTVDTLGEFSKEDGVASSGFQSSSETIKDAGDITIKSENGSINFKEDAELVSSVFKNTEGRNGKPGDITLTANNGKVSLDDTRIFSTIEREAISTSAEPSKISINAGSLELRSRSQIQTLVREVELNSDDSVVTPAGNGKAGTIDINVSDTVTLNGTDTLISSELQQGTEGTGGDIKINARSLFLEDGAQINTSTSGKGNAGDVTITAIDDVSLTGNETDTDNETVTGNETGIFSEAKKGSQGSAGSINIDPKRITIRDGAEIQVDDNRELEEDNDATAGSITLVGDRLTLDNGKITAETQAINGGNITLNVKDLFFLQNNSFVSATAGQKGTGGNVTIEAPDGFVVAIPDRNNDIVAKASEGKGGNIDIEAQNIFGFVERASQPLNQTNDIDASSDFGTQGTVDINTPDVDPANSITALPGDVVDPSNQIDQGCAAFDEETASEFRITGRGGLPPSPDQPLNSNTVWEDTRTTATAPQNLRANTTAKTPTVEPNKITPAAGWVFKENGEVTLVASASKATPEKLGSAPQSCPTR